MISILCENERMKKNCADFSEHKFVSFLLSHKIFAFFYGIFLFSYENWFTRDIVTAIHPIFIIWGGFLVSYDLFIQKSWERVFLQKLLFLFAGMAVVTGIVNYKAGILENIKVCILTMLPILVLYPTCFLEKTEKIKSFIFSFLGAALTVFGSSLISVYMFLIRFGGTITFLGRELTVGISEGSGTGEAAYVVLNGVYVDSGHAATFAMSFVIYSGILFWACRKEIFGKGFWNIIGIIFSVLNIGVQLCYFTLANSRGGWLSFFVAGFAGVFLYSFFCGFQKMNKKYRCIVAICIAVCAVGFSWFFLVHLRNTISHVSFIVAEQGKEHVETEKTDESKIAEEEISNISTDQAEIEEQGELQDSEKNIEQKTPSAEVPKNVSEQEPKKSEEDSFKRPEESGDNIGSGRIGIWKEAIALYLKRPFLGECPGNNAYYAEKYDIGEILRDGKAIHNSYLDLLVDYGLVGFVLLMCFYVRCAWKVLLKLVRDSKNYNSSVFLAIGGVVITMCSSFFLSCSFVNTTAMYFTNLIFMSYLLSESFLSDPIESKEKH